MSDKWRDVPIPRTAVYLLDDQHQPVRAIISTVGQFFDWSERWNQQRSILHEEVAPGLFVSTIFLGIDHSYSIDPDHTPLLFETMVFNDYEAGDQWRYHTYDEAVAGHAAVVEMIRARITASGGVTQ